MQPVAIPTPLRNGVAHTRTVDALMASVPASMRAEHRWILWKAKPRPNGRVDKVPCDVIDGWVCDANDAANWGTFDEAMLACHTYQLDGVGFVLDDESGWVATDLDQCILPDGTIEPTAREIVAAIESYTEYSPSGKGLHIWARGGLPNGRRKNGHIEMYDGGRFITVTGKHVAGTPTEAHERDFELRDVHARHVQAGDAVLPGDTEESLTFDAREPPVRLPPIDRELWDGTRICHKPDGSVDRSVTLYAIAMLLARSGATRWVIAQAVAERDRSLGLNKYADRRDDREYRRLAARAWATIEQECRLLGKTREERELRAELAKARERIEALERQMQEEREKHSLAFAALRGQAVEDPSKRIPAAERVTEVMTVFAVESGKAAGKQDDAGFVPVRLQTLADSAGCSPDTVSRHLRKAESRGIVEIKRSQNPDTGYTDLAVRLTAPAEETLRQVARQERDAAWGGSADRGMKVCVDHPDGGLVKRWVTACRVCGQEVDRGEGYLEPIPADELDDDDTPDRQDAVRGSYRHDNSTDRQDAGRSDDEWTSTGGVQPPSPPTRKMRVAPPPRSYLVQGSGSAPADETEPW